MAEQFVVVTGAAKGIGRAITLHLARQGYHVIAGVRKEADGTALVAEVGNQVTPIHLDITERQMLLAAAEKARALVGDNGLAGLVNNAGIAVAAPLEFIPIDELRNQVEINVIGQVAVTQVFLPLLRHGKGRIVNISSMAGRVAGQGTGPYHASKFAMEALTDTLRQELAPWGIDVVSIQPGVIATPIWETSLARARQLLERLPPEAYQLYGRQIERQLAQAEKSQARGIDPIRVAEAVLQALPATRPRTRYQVGMDGKIAVRLIARLPDRWRDWLLARLG
ncbi:MAG: SDR family oxidoreductase [Caldilineaceae bacterium]|nr:SDR family oxidoreductase [Caldilineaceae bacterium]